MARFIDPRVDWAFKRIFGSEDTKECLITFLNGLFEDELVIKDVTFAKTEKLGLRPDDRGVVFDVKRSFAPTWCLPICRHASECPTGCVLCTSSCHCSTSTRRQSVWIYLIVGFI